MITASDQLRLNAFLKRFNCNESECITYLELLKLGTSSVQDLARMLKRNRVSVYYSVEQLIEKGLLFEIRKGKRRFVVAASPEIFSKIIQQRNNELKSLENEMDYISKILNSVEEVKHEITLVKQYEEIAGFKKMLEETLYATKEIDVFSNSEAFLMLLGEEYYEKYFVRKVGLGILTRMILPPCDFAYKLNAKRHEYNLDLRLLTQYQVSESGFYLWNNTIAIESHKENKRSCTMIENKDVASFFRESIFNPFWKESKPIDNN